MDDEEVLDRLTRLYVPVSARHVRRDEAEAFLKMWREMEQVEADRYGNAYMDGWHAQRTGLDVEDDQPHDENAQAFSYREWIAGWCDRRDAEKHGRDLSLDEKLGYN